MKTERMRVYGHLYRARLAGTTATLTLAEWEQTVADFHGLCAYCSVQTFTVLEHFLPVSEEGTHVRNCVPACGLCNKKKHNNKGDELITLFGLSVIEHIQTYLASRVAIPDPPEELNKRRHWYTNPKRESFRTESGDPYKTINQLANEMGYSRHSIKNWMREMGMKQHKFSRHADHFISTSDAEILKVTKKSRQPDFTALQNMVENS